MSVRNLLLCRSGLAFVPAGGGRGSERLVSAVELELANLGYVLSYRLRARLLGLDAAALAECSRAFVEPLAAQLGANRKHEPLFRKFPDGVPEDTFQLWLRRVLVHFFQDPEEPCLSCGRAGKTHVLRPCHHVICEGCFDGSNYSACPICNAEVDRSSPFFRLDDVPRGLSPKERVRFKRLDLVEDVDTAARGLFLALCARPQAMSPDDVAAFLTLVEGYGLALLGWLPAEIPVRENVAHLFGTLLKRVPVPAVLDAARPFLKTATDVLRLLAVFSGADPSLQAEQRWVPVDAADLRRWSEARREAMRRRPTHVTSGGKRRQQVTSIQTSRFKVARLSRPLRRALLQILEGIPRETLVEDMLRHRADWVWMGEFLHPTEQARRFPGVAPERRQRDLHAAGPGSGGGRAVLDRRVQQGRVSVQQRGHLQRGDPAHLPGDHGLLRSRGAPEPVPARRRTRGRAVAVRLRARRAQRADLPAARR